MTKHITDTDLNGIPIVSAQANGDTLSWNGTNWISRLTASSPITGYTSGAGVISPTDSILQAIQKLNGNSDGKWILDGNTVTAIKNFGTIDNFELPFITNNIERARFDTSGRFGVGETTLTAKVDVLGEGIGSSTYGLKVKNQNLDITLSVRDDSYISAGISNGNLTIGLNSGFNSTVSANTFVGTNNAPNITTAFGNTTLGNGNLEGLTSGYYNVAIGGAMAGDGINPITSYDNVAIGPTAMGMTVFTHKNVAVGFAALLFSATNGGHNTAMGYFAGRLNNNQNNTYIGAYSGDGATGELCTFLGSNTGRDNVGNENTFLGVASGRFGVNNSASIFVGAYSGFHETASNKLIVDSVLRASEADQRVKAILYGVIGANTSAQELHINAAKINVDDLPVGNAGLVTGDLYADTAANILANGDLVIGRKV